MARPEAHIRLRSEGVLAGDALVIGRVEDALQVEGSRAYGEVPVLVPRPLLSRAVAVELDPVSVGIVEVQRLADAVVGGAVQRNPGVDEPPQRIAEGRPVGIADG